MVTLQVVNAVSQQPLAGLAVMAKQHTGTGYVWFASGTTDATGRASFKLTGVSTGVRFAFSAAPYTTGTVQSDDVTQPGSFRFAVGTMPVSVVAGGTNAPLAALNVNLKEKLADGTYANVANGATDSSSA